MCNQFLRVVDEIAVRLRTPAAFDDVDNPFTIGVNCNGEAMGFSGVGLGFGSRNRECLFEDSRGS